MLPKLNLKKLRRLRLAKNLSVSAVSKATLALSKEDASHTHVNRCTIDDLEQGRRLNPTIGTLSTLAAVYGYTDVGALLTGLTR
jgi:transcriptional regulator with XRE-family HTH domain